jgi:CspA family cold shock protein
MQGTPTKTGVVDYFHQKRGYGFIAGNDSVDYFFHRTALISTTVVEKGQSVEFEVGQFRGRPVAVCVRVPVPAASATGGQR